MQDESDQAVADVSNCLEIISSMHVPVLCRDGIQSRFEQRFLCAKLLRKSGGIESDGRFGPKRVGRHDKRKNIWKPEQFLRDALWLATGGGSASIRRPSPQHATVKSEERDVVALASRLSSQKLERWEPYGVN